MSMNLVALTAAALLFDFDIPALPLDQALVEAGSTALPAQIGTTWDLDQVTSTGVTTAPLKGRMTLFEALKRLVVGQDCLAIVRVDREGDAAAVSTGRPCKPPPPTQTVVVYAPRRWHASPAASVEAPRAPECSCSGVPGARWCWSEGHLVYATWGPAQCDLREHLEITP
jgi:hypothetical protein